MERFCRSSTSVRKVSICFFISSSWVLEASKLALKRVLDPLHLAGDLAVDLGDLVVDLDHRRIARLEGLELLLILGDERVALVAQPLDDLVGEKLRHVDGVGLRHLLPLLLVLDALGNELPERGIGARQVAFGDRRLLGDGDDLLLLGKLQQLAARTPPSAASGA